VEKIWFSKKIQTLWEIYVRRQRESLKEGDSLGP